MKRIKFSHSQTRTNNKIFFNTSFYHPFQIRVGLTKKKKELTSHIFFTKVTNNEQKRTCVKYKLYLQTKVENIKFYLSLKTNQKFLSLNSTSLAKYLQKSSAKKLTLFIVTVYCITTNIFYTGSKCETNRKYKTTTITTTSLSLIIIILSQQFSHIIAFFSSTEFINFSINPLP